MTFNLYHPFPPPEPGIFVVIPIRGIRVIRVRTTVLTVARVLTTLVGVLVLRVFHGAVIAGGHTLHLFAVAVVAGDLERGQPR